MDRRTQWLCLIGGVSLFVYAVARLVFAGEWTLVLISGLIIAFTVSSMLRSKQE